MLDYLILLVDNSPRADQAKTKLKLELHALVMAWLASVLAHLASDSLTRID
jgi:hypothetical protein